MHVDWDDLMGDASNAPTANISMDVNDDTMTLRVEVQTDYVGFALADDETPGYGMMYVIDFEDMDASQMDIRETGTCANRDASATSALSWEDIWQYSQYQTGNWIDGTYSAYQPSDDWNISKVGSGDCEDVKWTGKWTWYDLMDCANNAQDTNYVVITEDASWVNMSGTVVVNLVSPLGLNTDTGTLCTLLISNTFWESVISSNSTNSDRRIRDC